MRRSLRIGTRGSELARWQAAHVVERLAQAHGGLTTEIVVISTAGDALVDVPLSQVEGRAFFTKEIEEALLGGEIDLAVHSLKDLATELPQGLVIGAVLARADPRDVLLSRRGESFEALPAGARIGTSSLRRRALLGRWRGDVDVVDLRGNVPTRLRRLAAGDFDALVLAAAGVERLGAGDRVSEFLPLERVLPAPGQGAIAVEVRANDAAALALLATLEHPGTRAAITAERALLGRLEGGCQVPVGALAEPRGEALLLRAVVCSLDGSRAAETRVEGLLHNALELAERAAESLLRQGAGAILADVRTPRAGS